MSPSVFPKVSVCLLNYRGAPFVEACAAALQRLDPVPGEIIAVDNASPDGSGERWRALSETVDRPPIRFVPAGGNLGYAAGHNLGARHATGEYLAFLNVTAEPESAWLEVVRWMEDHPEVAFAQPAVFHRADPTRLESLGSVFRPSGQFRVVGRNHREGADRSGPVYCREVVSVLGAAFVARATEFRALGGFDESFFMYFEETDLCWRAWLRGRRTVTWFDPARPTRVFHTMHGTHPPGFRSTPYFERNRTISLFRNLERRNLPWLAANLAIVTSESAREPRRFLRYLREVAGRFPAAVASRAKLQHDRVTGDSRIFGLYSDGPIPAGFAPPPMDD